MLKKSVLIEAFLNILQNGPPLSWRFQIAPLNCYTLSSR
jgi:hypothetical protein